MFSCYQRKINFRMTPKSYEALQCLSFYKRTIKDQPHHNRKTSFIYLVKGRNTTLIIQMKKHIHLELNSRSHSWFSFFGDLWTIVCESNILDHCNTCFWHIKETVIYRFFRRRHSLLLVGTVCF